MLTQVSNADHLYVIASTSPLGATGLLDRILTDASAAFRAPRRGDAPPPPPPPRPPPEPIKTTERGANSSHPREVHGCALRRGITVAHFDYQVAKAAKAED